MSLAVVTTRANIGIEAPVVRVEAHLSNGLPGFTIVGLPETAVKESKERVRSALLNSQLDFPDKRITINLAPADLPKSGGRYDLAIAIGILAASGQVPVDSLPGVEFLGELALSGELRAISAALPGILAAQNAGHTVIIPQDNEKEAGLVSKGKMLVSGHLLDVISHLKQVTGLKKAKAITLRDVHYSDDMCDVIGQSAARRALTVAAAGNHNLLMQGPPGTGKTMLASRICTILPPMDENGALEVAALRSIASRAFEPETWRVPPFRAPHHTASSVALVGGGSTLKVGEISLAHNGVLFLDELPEFSPKVLEVLREPLESGYISISRANYQVRLPANFQLIAAMNPCPCGYHGDPDGRCRCSREKIRQYQSRVSGPLMDRIDMHVQVSRLSDIDREELLKADKSPGKTSESIRANVIKANARQFARAGKNNASLSQAEMRLYCKLAPEEELRLKQAMHQLKLSTRAFFRILKMARTIADLDDATDIGRNHLLEAIAFRFPQQCGTSPLDFSQGP